MFTPQSVGSVILGLFISSVAASALGQQYPNRPIRIITSAAGGSGDFVTRVLTQGDGGLPDVFDQPVVVENRPSSVVGVITKQAEPDGYTALVIGSSFWLAPLLKKVPYDPLRDFAPVSLLFTSPYFVIVNPSLQVTSVKELIALAKSRKGQLRYAMTIPGTPVHLGSELFKTMTGVDMLGVAYKGTGAMVNAVIGGEVQVLVAPAAAALPQIKSGKVRALAVTSSEPSALLPQLPTVASSGLPGYEIVNSNGMFAPAQTPAAIVNRLNHAAIRAMNRPDAKARLLAQGVETLGTTPKKFATTIKADMVSKGKIIRAAGIKPQ